jgi:hypothetical protein
LLIKWCTETTAGYVVVGMGTDENVAGGAGLKVRGERGELFGFKHQGSDQRGYLLCGNAVGEGIELGKATAGAFVVKDTSIAGVGIASVGSDRTNSQLQP